MKIAVVGASGVLGRALIPLLIDAGHSVRALVRSAEKTRSLFGEQVEIVECDMLAADTAGRLPGLLEACDVVTHIATSIPNDPTAPDAWAANTKLRTQGVHALLDAALRVGVDRYIQQSISMAYPDRGDAWIMEDAPLDTSPARAGICGPVIEMERMVKAVPPARMACCILRGGAFVGPGTFQERTLEDLRAGKALVPCDGHNFLSLIHVADMASAVVAALRAPAASTFNIVAEPLSEADYLDRLAAAIGAVRPGRDTGAACPPSWRCSNRAAADVLGWLPVHSILGDPQ